MCGIAGWLALDGENLVAKSDLNRMTTALAHRGPDGHGTYSAPRVFLGHTRLSIIDLPGGAQPIYSEDRRKCVIFNGEIYNFQELRRELESRGHRFASRTDTEVIVHAYEEYGPRCVELFRGMFAFALWDEDKRELLLARDRLGVKPLYVAECDGNWFFASEIKAILSAWSRPRQIDPVALVAYLNLGYVPAPWTIFKGIRKLQPATTLIVGSNGHREHVYWDVQFDEKEVDYRVQQDELEDLIARAVKLRLIADVPLGAFLSGGIDSGLVVAMMAAQSNAATQTFCAGFGGDIGGYFDERAVARKVASMHGTLHREIEVYPPGVDVLGEVARTFDEPFADSGAIPASEISRETRRFVKVALSGLGGDEMFGGYERYLGFRIGRWLNFLPRVLRRKVLVPLADRVSERSDGVETVNRLKRLLRATDDSDAERYFDYLRISPQQGAQNILSSTIPYDAAFSELQERFAGVFNGAPAEDPLDRVFYMDLKSYVPDDVLALTDRTSMRHGLEVRVPLLDHELVEYCASIPSRKKVSLFGKKRILKKIARRHLPGEVFAHRKQGFIGPMGHWMRQPDWTRAIGEVLAPSRLDAHGLFRTDSVQSIVERHQAGIESNQKIIWALMVFQVWFETYISQIAHEAPIVSPAANGRRPTWSHDAE